MSRLSIELTPEQHQQLTAIAALHGQTLKDYILERTLLAEHCPSYPSPMGLSPAATLCVRTRNALLRHRRP